MLSPNLAMYGFGATELLLIAFIIGVMAIPAILAFIVLSRVPAEHRKQTPGLAFLLMIPLFSLVWAFFVHPKVAASLKSYFTAKGDDTAGDCGASHAQLLCIFMASSIIPVLGLLGAIAALVLLILFYIKAFELSSRIAPNTQSAA